eukprot:1140875-Pelagomonas_calceolata.AAC.1
MRVSVRVCYIDRSSSWFQRSFQFHLCLHTHTDRNLLCLQGLFVTLSLSACAYWQELVVTPDVILILQTQLEGALLEWHTHTAAETLKGRLTDNEFTAFREDKCRCCGAQQLAESLGHPGFIRQIRLCKF